MKHAKELPQSICPLDKKFGLHGVLLKMVDVVIDEVKYITDIPIELLSQAISAGEIRKGKVIGLVVKPHSEPNEDVLIELKLETDGQENLIHRGTVIPIEQKGRVYVLDEGWETYTTNTQKTIQQA